MINDYTKYAELLEKYSIFTSVLLIIIVVVVLVLIVFCLINHLKKVAILTLIVGIVLSLTTYFFCVFPYQKDIRENAYTVYSGEFYVEECYYVNRGGTYILIGYNDGELTRYKILCDTSFIKNQTKYDGKIICSKNSKCIVDIQGVKIEE